MKKHKVKNVINIHFNYTVVWGDDFYKNEKT